MSRDPTKEDTFGSVPRLLERRVTASWTRRAEEEAGTRAGREEPARLGSAQRLSVAVRQKAIRGLGESVPVNPGNVPGSTLQHLLKKSDPVYRRPCQGTPLSGDHSTFYQTFLSGIQVKTGTHINPVDPAHLVVMPNGRYPD